MLLSGLALVLLSAIFHAASNVPLKQSTDKLAFAWWMLAAFCIPALPAIFFIPSVKPVAWMIVVGSGLLEAIYFVALARAYTAGELSVIYPITRGSAPLFLLCWALVFLGERPTRYGLLGIFVVVAGLYLLHPPPSVATNSGESRWRPTMWALMTGFTISIYSALDKIGIQYFSPFVYLWLILLVCWIALSPQWLFANRRVALLQFGSDLYPRTQCEMNRTAVRDRQ